MLNELTLTYDDWAIPFIPPITPPYKAESKAKKMTHSTEHVLTEQQGEALLSEQERHFSY